MAMKQQALLFDGIKAIPAWDVDSMRGWVSLDGTDTTDRDKLAQAVPWLYRGIKDRANMVAKMPFSITSGGADFDTSTDYENKLKFFPNPRRLFKQVTRSLIVAGKAYCFLETNRGGYITAVKYVAPTTITEVYDKTTGELTHYERTLNSRKLVVKPSNIVAFYDPDHLTEIGPGAGSDALAALVSAGVLHNADKFVSAFFERGAIKATVLTVTAGQKDAEKLQSWWDDVVGGVKNAWSAFVMRGDTVKPVVIGEGLESLHNEQLTQERRQDIATALGIPESRLWSSAANYATAEQDTKNYIEGTIVPDCELIAEAFNAQVFTKEHNLDGYRLEFLPETMDIFQKDTAEQAAAAKSFIDFLTACPTAEIAEATCGMIGFELTDELTKAIETWFKDKEKQAEEMQQSMANPADPNAPPQDEEQRPPQADEREVRTALATWKRKALHSLKETGSAVVAFTTSVLPARQVEAVRYELEACKTPDEVKRVFEMFQPQAQAPQPDGVAELKRANDLLERALANG